MASFPVPASIFREYDVRGVAETQLGSDLFRALGRAFAPVLEAGLPPGKGPRCVAVGRDCRLSSPRLHDALVDGLTRAGLDVVDIGVGPTPLLYFAVHHLKTDGGLMITGSHNPSPENGVKMLRSNGSIFGAEIQDLRQRIEQENFGELARGSVESVDVQPAYVEHMVSNIRLKTTELPFVVDAGNGAGGPLALAAMKALGLRPTALYCEMDGRFPNHHPDPTQPENVRELVETVRSTGARVGIAYDGDADRLGAIDADGSIVWGDRLLTLFARDILRDHPGAAILGEVKCSQTLYDDVKKQGGRPILWKTGHSLIKTKMKQEHALLAGEMSGHLFFADRYFGYDDAIYASLRLLEILARDPRSISEMLADVPRTYATPEIRLDCPDSIKFDVVAAVRSHYRATGLPVVDIDGARIGFGSERDPTWGLVRASNTGPVLVMRFEATTPEKRDAIRAEVEGVVAAARARFAHHAAT